MSVSQGRILVVDDDDVDREKFRRLVARGGLDVEIVEATSGAEALRLLGEQRFDTVVVDYRLGDTTGIDIVQYIKKHKLEPLPIIMITGLGDERVAVSAIREGVHEYLTKNGLNAAEVAHTVTSALRRAQLERKLAEANAARETAEQRLRQSREQLDDARRVGLLGAIHVDIETGEQTWSDEVYRLLGIEPGSCAPTRANYLRRVHPEDAPGLSEASERFHGDQAPLHHAYRLVMDDGTVRHVVANGRLVRDADGVPRMRAALVQDVTARREAEIAAGEREAQIRGLFEASSKGILFARMDGAISRVNPAMCELSGFTEDELTGMRLTDLVRADDGPEVELRGRLLEVHDAERRLRHKDGSLTWVSISMSAARNVAGETTAFAVIVSDVTEQKTQQAILIAARDAAEAAARAKADFLAKMSHEIRTPMNSVIGMTELTLETELSAEQRELLEMACSAAKGLLHLMNDVLDFSRAEAAGLSLERVPFDVRECATRVVRGVRHRAEAKGLALVLAVSGDVPPSVLGDPHRLTQVLGNLVSNAIKFTHQGEVRVSVNVDAFAGERCTLHFSVADTGIGIPAEKYGLIFEAFGQADETVSRMFGGTGLGLAICKQLAELMKGRLWVESEGGHGSTFQFTLDVPIAPAASGEPGIAGVIGPAGELRRQARKPLRILVAEDNSMNQRLIEVLLGRAGHAVTIVGDGRAALDRLEVEEFDVVLMDVQMPGMSGLEAASALRAREAGGARRVPVVALTAQAMNGDAERCVEAGMDGYVSKPVELATLERVMERAMATAAEARPGQAGAGEPYDRALLQRRIGADPQLLATLCEIFESRAGVLLSGMRGFIDRQDPGRLAGAAHELKGMLLNLAATDAGPIARDLEAAGQGARYEEAAACLARLAGEVPRLVSALRASAQGSSA